MNLCNFDYTQGMLIIGLSGGIGSGKSTVAALFAEHGAGIIDTDAISHRLTQADGMAMAAISAAFGKNFITDDGALNRVKMRGLIFSDTSARQRLERILHPLIFEQAQMQLCQLQDKPYTLIVVPLLFESRNFMQLVQRVLVVDCAEEIRIERVIARSGMTAADVRAIIARQTARSDLLRMADDVISNDAGLDNLTSQVAVLHQSYSKTQNSN